MKTTEMKHTTQKKRITMLTIKEASELVDGITPYRVRQLCIQGLIPHIKAGRKYLINKDKYLEYFER